MCAVNAFMFSWHWKVPIPVTKELAQVAQSCHKSCSYIHLFLFELFIIISLSESEKLEYANFPALSIQILTHITNTGVQTGPTSGITWGNFLLLFCVPPAISGWKYPLLPWVFSCCTSLNAAPEADPAGSVAGLGGMHRAELPALLWCLSDLRSSCRSSASLLQLFASFIPKAIPQQFAGAAVINEGKDLCRRTGKVWLYLNSIAGF